MQKVMTQGKSRNSSTREAILKRAALGDGGSRLTVPGHGRKRRTAAVGHPAEWFRHVIEQWLEEMWHLGRLNFKAHPRPSSQRHDSGIVGGTTQNGPEIDLLQRLAAFWGCGGSSPHRIAQAWAGFAAHDVQKHRNMACPAAAVDPHPG